tara:strand:+ start:203 stop:529 length:327 start_codon:yes stop_codon:yes gene_type:complete
MSQQLLLVETEVEKKVEVPLYEGGICGDPPLRVNQSPSFARSEKPSGSQLSPVDSHRWQCSCDLASDTRDAEVCFKGLAVEMWDQLKTKRLATWAQLSGCDCSDPIED